MALPFNLGHPSKISIEINGYDARRLIDKQKERQRKDAITKIGSSKLVSANVPTVAMPPPNKPLVVADDVEIESLNCALQAAPDPEFQELFNGTCNEN